MKRLWISVAILVLVFSLALYHTYSLKGFTAQLSTLLSQAEVHAKAGRWEDAQTRTGQAYQRWTDWEHYLHIVLRHADIDDILSDFHQVRELIACRAMDEYAAANAKLITEIGLLYEAESLTLTNIL